MPVTLTNLVDRVYELTNRPDLTVETKYAVKSVTLRAHNSEEFTPDIVTVAATAVKDEDTGLYQIDVTTSPFVNFKKVIGIINPTTNRQLDEVDPTTLIDSYGFLSNNVFYMAGFVINIRSTGISTVNVTYLKKPVVTDGGYSSWIADNYEELIAIGAAASVLHVIGKADEATRLEKLFREGLYELKANYMRI